MGGSEPAAQSLLVSACYLPQDRGYPQSLLPPCLPLAGLLREHPAGAWQSKGLPREVICGCPSPRSVFGWSGGIKGPAWEIIPFLCRQFLAHLSQKRAQQSTCSFSPIERGLVPWKVPALLGLLIAC